MVFSYGTFEFQEEVALYAKELCVHDSLHFGRWSFPLFTARVALQASSDRRGNIALSAGGHALAVSALRTSARS